MASILVCNGELSAPTVTEPSGVCSTGFEIVSYDNSALLTQITTLNTFDPVLAFKTIGFCCLVFTIGFVAGIIIRNMRRL